MSTLTELRDRVAALKGQDRGADAEVYRLLGDMERERPGSTTRADPDPERYARWLAQGYGSDVPSYTASVDDVLSLIERTLPGWSYRMAGGGGHPAYVELLVEAAGIEHPQNDADAPTPALALLLALLEAKSSGETS